MVNIISILIALKFSFLSIYVCTQPRPLWALFVFSICTSCSGRVQNKTSSVGIFLKHFNLFDIFTKRQIRQCILLYCCTNHLWRERFIPPLTAAPTTLPRLFVAFAVPITRPVKSSRQKNCKVNDGPRNGDISLNHNPLKQSLQAGPVLVSLNTSHPPSSFARNLLFHSVMGHHWRGENDYDNPSILAPNSFTRWNGPWNRELWHSNAAGMSERRTVHPGPVIRPQGQFIERFTRHFPFTWKKPAARCLTIKWFDNPQ